MALGLAPVPAHDTGATRASMLPASAPPASTGSDMVAAMPPSLSSLHSAGFPVAPPPPPMILGGVSEHADAVREAAPTTERNRHNFILNMESPDRARTLATGFRRDGRVIKS